MGTNSAGRLFRFGVFEADEHTGELRKQGRRLPLQGQPLQVLLLLLERAGELVSRTEIQQRLWPDGTFVDFDHGLNTAINKIRESLGDSASSPRFVETLAKRGYRFIAPVEVASGNSAGRQRAGVVGSLQAAPAAVDAGTLESPVAAQVQPTGMDSSWAEPASTAEGSTSVPEERESSERAPAQQGPGKTRGLLASPEDLPDVPRPVVRILFLLLQVMYLGFYAVSLARLGIVQSVIRAMVPHTLWAPVLLIVTAAIGIPTRLYLISAEAFNAPGLRENFLRIFPVIFPLDELWALAPFLLAPWIGFGSALGATAALLYAPFAQRSLILMGAGAPARAKRTAES